MKKFLVPILIIVLVSSAVFVLNRKSEAPQEKTSASKTQKNNSGMAAKTCTGKAITPLTEGPYYKAGSPERQSILEDNSSGTRLVLNGYVFDTDCKPIANARIDFWQADGEGNYDNSEYKFRGHQYTDDKGFYRLETVIPGEYSGRTEHIHFKIKASDDSQEITSQLFFPDGSKNSSDSIFDETLVVTIKDDPDGSKFASYNFVIPR